MVAIYKITSPSGRVYIGQSWNIYRRLKVYRSIQCKKQIKLYNSLKKYGWNSHKFEIIHELPKDISQEVLDSYEILYWDLYKNCNINMLNSKEPGSGGKLSQETKDKISMKALGRKPSDETRKRMSLSHIGNHQNKGRVLSDAHKIKIGLSKIGNKYNVGKILSDDNKKKLLESKKGKPLSAEHKEKIRLSLIGNKRAVKKT